jgi:TolB-like protein
MTRSSRHSMQPRRTNNIGVICLLSVACLLTTGLAGCATTSKQAVPLTIAVLDIENLSPDDSTGTDLGELLSSEIIGRLSEKLGVQVIERQKLLNVLQELKLGSSELTEESVRLKVGRILGARQMVFGSYLVSGTSMRLDLRLVDVETGRILKTAKKTVTAGDVNSWVEAAGEAADMLM